MPLIAPPALSPRESAAVSYLRAAAFLSIVACHYLQAYHCAAAWVMNIGVQVFLCLSGYLYGHKVVAHPVQWLRRRVRKLYVPYALMVVATLAALVLLTDIRPTLTAVVNYTLCLQGLKGGVPHSGLEHLWFLTAILLCYLATPFLQWLRGRFTPPVLAVFILIGVLQYGVLHYSLFCFSWFYLYALGYLFPVISPRLRRGVDAALLLGAVALSLGISWAEVLDYDGVPNRLLHDLWGSALVVCGVPFAARFVRRVPRPVKLLSDYSYCGYIAHHPFLLGSLAIISACFSAFSFVLSLCAIVATTVVLQHVSKRSEGLA